MAAFNLKNYGALADWSNGKASVSSFINNPTLNYSITPRSRPFPGLLHLLHIPLRTTRLVSTLKPWGTWSGISRLLYSWL